MKKLILMAIALLALVLFGASAAFAAASANGPLVTTAGSSAKFYHSGDYFTICDTRGEGDWVYVKFHYSGHGDIQLENHGGNGSCINRAYNITEGVTVEYKSCISDAFNDTCSGWVKGVA